MTQEKKEVAIKGSIEAGKVESKKTYIKPEMKAHEPLERSATTVYYYYYYV